MSELTAVVLSMWGDTSWRPGGELWTWYKLTTGHALRIAYAAP